MLLKAETIIIVFIKVGDEKMTQYLVYDVGGTNLKYALMDHSGNILTKGKVVSPDNLPAFKQALIDIADQFEGEFTAIAMCAPGKIDVHEKTIYYGGALTYLDGFNLEENLGARYQVPVSVENDGKAAALAEQWLGELKGVDTGAIMTLGTGVGGGIIANGTLLHGRDFQAGELSWMLLRAGEGLKKITSYTAYLCSAVQMIERINEALGNDQLDDGLAAFAAINRQEPVASDIFKDYCANIAQMILNVQTVINGEKIVIGGGISAQPILLDEINYQFEKLLSSNEMLGGQIIPPEIVAAHFQNDANLYGALYALLLQLDENN